MNRWSVLRARTHSQWFEGIEAVTAEEAIAKFLEGDGELNLERDQWSNWHLDAELEAPARPEGRAS